MIVLFNDALHLLLKFLLLVKHRLALHNVKLRIRGHGFDVVPILAAHLLTSLKVARLRRGSKRQSDFGRSEDTQAHSIVFTANSAHIWHFAVAQKLVSGLHLGTFEHLQVVYRLLDFFTVDRA